MIYFSILHGLSQIFTETFNPCLSVVFRVRFFFISTRSFTDLHGIHCYPCLSVGFRVRLTIPSCVEVGFHLRHGGVVEIVEQHDEGTGGVEYTRDNAD